MQKVKGTRMVPLNQDADPEYEKLWKIVIAPKRSVHRFILALTVSLRYKLCRMAGQLKNWTYRDVVYTQGTRLSTEPYPRQLLILCGKY